MNTALITGTTSGIGECTARKLISQGWSVYGISRSDPVISSDSYHHITANLTDGAGLEQIIRSLNADISFNLLVNNAGCGYYGLHEELSPAKIHEMVAVNIEAPMIITALMLRGFKANKGTIVNISSVTANKVNTHGAAYGATKAALSSFGHSIFDEARKSGVRVINIYPDMTATKLYRNADFEASGEYGCSLNPEDVADAVISAVNMNPGLVINDITIKPQFHRLKRK